MSSSNVGPWLMLGAAVIGAVSATAIFLIQRFQQKNENRRLRTLNDTTIASLQEEIRILRQLQREKSRVNLPSKPRQKKAKSSSASSTTSEVYTSPIASDVDDDEFYDCSSDEYDEDLSESVDLVEHEIRKIDEAINFKYKNKTDTNSIFMQLIELDGRYPRNAEILWRFGKVLQEDVNLTEDKITKQELISKGLEKCKSAVSLNPNCGICHKWYATYIGFDLKLRSSTEQVSLAPRFDEELRQALRLAPDDPELRHMQGRYYYETAQLNWGERMFFTSYMKLNVYTFEEALDRLLEAERLHGRTWKENSLYIAKCYQGLGEENLARERLMEAKHLKPISYFEETLVHEEVTNLLEKY